MPRRQTRGKTVKLVRSGSAVAKIYTTERQGRRYYTVSWYCGGQRCRKHCGTLAVARSFAKVQADQVNAGLAQWVKISPADAKEFTEAKRRLGDLTIPLHSVVQEYVSLRTALGGHGTLLQAVECFRSHHIQPVDKSTIRDIYKEFVEAKKANGCSEVYLNDCRLRLSRFAKAFPGPIAAVQTRDIEDWLRGLNGSLGTRDNFRRLIITLFNFAKRRGYLSRNNETEAKWLEKPRRRSRPIQIFTSGELREILAASSGQARLAIAIGAFAGIRSAEILRLNWENFKWEQEVIDIGSDQTKTASRRLAPILPPLRQWVEPFNKQQGRLLTYSQAVCLAEAFGAVAKKATKIRRQSDPDAPSLKWRQNGLRHSYASYRLAMIADASRVALEMGNSQQEIFSHYRKVVTLPEAQAWFSVFPTQIVSP
jgi:integrase